MVQSVLRPVSRDNKGLTRYALLLLLRLTVVFFLKKMMIGYPSLLNNDVAPVIGLPLCGVRHVN